MVSSKFFLLILVLPMFINAQSTKEVIKTFYKSKQVYEQYWVLESNPSIKHGPFVSYKQMTENQWKDYKKGRLNLDGFVQYKGFYNLNKKDSTWYEKGNIRSYKNGKKAGIWTESIEKGQVILRYDHDKQMHLEPIFNLNIKYPAKARENNVEGEVIVSYLVNSDCSISNVRISKSLSKECDDAVLNKMAIIAKYYQNQIKNCILKEKEFKCRFAMTK